MKEILTLQLEIESALTKIYLYIKSDEFQNYFSLCCISKYYSLTRVGWLYWGLKVALQILGQKKYKSTR